MNLEFVNIIDGSTVIAKEISKDVWYAVLTRKDGTIREYQRVVGTTDDAIASMGGKGYRLKENGFDIIPGFPMYEFNGHDVKSFYIDRVRGKLIVYNKFAGKEGFTLHHNGSKQRFTRQQLRERVNIMSKIFIVGSMTPQGDLSFANHPKQHFSETSVTSEVERLARQNPGKTFVYAEIKGSCVSNSLQWKR